MLTKLTITAPVIRGSANGRKIGFPTINLKVPSLELDFGVYVSRVSTPLGVYKGALHYGPRKVINVADPTLEIHLLDFSGDLYGQKVTVDILSKVRETMKFPDFATLQRQIALDVLAVKNFELELTDQLKTPSLPV